MENADQEWRMRTQGFKVGVPAWDGRGRAGSAMGQREKLLKAQ